MLLALRFPHLCLVLLYQGLVFSLSQGLAFSQGLEFNLSHPSIFKPLRGLPQNIAIAMKGHRDYILLRLVHPHASSTLKAPSRASLSPHLCQSRLGSTLYPNRTVDHDMLVQGHRLPNALILAKGAADVADVADLGLHQPSLTKENPDVIGDVVRDTVHQVLLLLLSLLVQALSTAGLALLLFIHPHRPIYTHIPQLVHRQRERAYRNPLLRSGGASRYRILSAHLLSTIHQNNSLCQLEPHQAVAHLPPPPLLKSLATQSISKFTLLLSGHGLNPVVSIAYMHDTSN